MNFIKHLIPNSIKQKGKEFLYDILKVPYSRSDVPLEVWNWLSREKPITYFDIGASVGHFSLNICAEYQVDKGIIVEPLAKHVAILEERFPDKDKFKILNIAIADSDAEANFYVNEAYDSVSSLLKMHTEKDELSSLDTQKMVSQKIRTQTLDTITREQQLSAIDLIKIDVQGAEHLVLKSGIETLKKTKLVYTEFSFKPLYEESSTFFDLYKTLYDNNFMLVNISPGYTSPNGELLQGDALFLNKRFAS
jgi:FkbM family methyltransferase